MKTGMKMKSAGKSLNPRQLRHRLGVNQMEFWSAVGVTQSGGSRYETGRSMPKPVRELVRLVHVEGINLSRARGEYIAVAEHLRSNNPALYQRIKREIQAKRSKSR
jgi:predicted transcriptional regulator